MKTNFKLIELITFFLIILTFILNAQDKANYTETERLSQRAATNFDTTGFDFQIDEGPFKPNRQSFAQYYHCPEWFRDAKFGIYMHWGLNSIPGFDGHYARSMYQQQEPEAAKRDRENGRSFATNMSGYKPVSVSVYQYHVKNFGHPSKFGYKDFIPLWKADKFDATALAALYKECGAKYIGVMAVHHDNFDLYNSTYQVWNSYRMGPKIDIVGEWKKACVAENLRFAITSHLSNGFHEHWFYQGEMDATGPMAGIPYDTMDPKNEGLYGNRTPDRLRKLNPEFAQNWFLRTKELIDKYNPDLLYLDGGLPNGDFGLNLAAHFYNHNININHKGVFTIKDKTQRGFTFDVESGGLGETMEDPWQVDASINPGWFYLGNNGTSTGESQQTATDDAGMSVVRDIKKNEDAVRLTAGQIIDNLVDIVSKNGNMMLNVGLRPDGSLPETYRRELLLIGQWLRNNGDAIYGTRPFTVFGEGPFRMPEKQGFHDNEFHFCASDIRFTQSKDGKAVYAIFLDWPGDGASVTIKSLGNNTLNSIHSVTMIGTGEKLKWSQDVNGLSITMPGKAFGNYAYVFKMAKGK
jgi:alpha-L-fucosidase